MKCEAIYTHSSEHSVRKMCKALELCESSYYQWLKGEKARERRQEKEQELIKQVRAVYEENHRIYGCRRMQRALLAAGISLSEWKVRRIMRENGMYPETIQKYRPGKRGKTDGRILENELNRDFHAANPDEKWVGDITYLKTSLGWVYLAAVIDLYNREVIGYSISRSIDSELTCSALGNALIRRRDRTGKLMFHSDRGCQYSSRRYQKMLSENGIRGSMSKAGCPYDNRCMESFFASLKKEYFYRREYATMDDVRKDLFYYIEVFYNRKRLHSSLGYLSPVAYRLQEQGGTAA